MSANSKIENAQIRKTFLGIDEDHGVFTCSLELCYGSSLFQHFGQHNLRFEMYGIEYLERILDAVGVKNWEDLPGHYVRADHEHAKIHGIGHITENKWFYPERDLGGYIE